MDVAELIIVAAITAVFVDSAKEDDYYLCDWLLLYLFLTDFRLDNCKKEQRSKRNNKPCRRVQMDRVREGKQLCYYCASFMVIGECLRGVAAAFGW